MFVFHFGARLETGLVQEPHCAAQLSEFSLVLVGRCIVLGFLGIRTSCGCDRKRLSRKCAIGKCDLLM